MGYECRINPANNRYEGQEVGAGGKDGERPREGFVRLDYFYVPSGYFAPANSARFGIH